MVPALPNAVYMVFGSSDYGPSVHEMLFIDRASGEILEDRDISQAKPLYWLGTWNYPLHVGTIWGLTIEDPVAGDLRGPDDVAGDRRLDVVAASPDGQAGPAPPRRCPPTALARRHNYGDQHFATDGGPLGGGVAGG